MESAKPVLSYIKCGRCREDRQKCLPEDRAWPQKCHRCIKKGLPCSEGKEEKPGRKRKRDQHGVNEMHARAEAIVSTVATLNPPQTTQLAAPESTEFPDWAFLLSWYPMLKQAMKKLECLKNDICELFKSEFDHPPQYKAFEQFTQRFKAVMLYQTTTALVSSNPRYRASRSGLAFRLLSACFNESPSTFEAECIVCAGASDADRLRYYEQTGDLVNELMCRISRVSGHLEARVTWTCQCNDQKLVQAEMAAINDMTKRITDKIAKILDGNAARLSLPETVRASAIFFPETVFDWEAFNANDELLDCLGRTRLHRLIDLGFPRTANEHKQLFEQIRKQKAGQATLKTSSPVDLLGRSQLHLYSDRQDCVLTGLFLGVLTDINRRTVFGHTPLHYAATRGNSAMCRYLLSFGEIDPCLTDTFDRTALFYPIRNGDWQTINDIMSADIFGLECKGLKSHESHLVRAFERNRYGLARLLLRSGSDPNVQIFSGIPLLHYTISKGVLDFAKLLLEFGADPNILDADARPPLYDAIRRMDIDALELLGSCERTNLNIMYPIRSVQVPRSCTPLSHAVDLDFRMGIAYLLGHTGADVNARTDLGRTLLHLAVESDRPEIVFLLLRHPSIDLQASDNMGDTVLHKASMVPSIQATYLLLRHPGINVNAQNNARQTPLMFALSTHGEEGITRLFLHDDRTDLTLEDSFGNTVLDIAIRRRLPDTVALIKTKLGAQQPPAIAQPDPPLSVSRPPAHLVTPPPQQNNQQSPTSFQPPKGASYLLPPQIDPTHLTTSSHQPSDPS